MHPSIGYRPAAANDIDFLYVPARTRVITWDGQNIGMLSVDEGDADIFLSTIKIRPEFQGKGIGADVIQEIIANGI